MSTLLLDWSGALVLKEKKVRADAQRKLTVAGIPITVENEVGDERSGVSPAGQPWSVKMTAPYGYIQRVAGFDGDELDCFVGPDPDPKEIYVVRTKNPDTNCFDEEKVCVGFRSEGAAKACFLANYDKPDHFESIHTYPTDEYRQWLFHLGTTSFSPRAAPNDPGVATNYQFHSPLDMPSGNGDNNYWDKGPYFRLEDRKTVPTVYFLRHAHTPDNGSDDDPLSQKVRGSRDIEPDADGRAEAKKVAQEFEGVRVAKIFTSPKKRAQVIAEAIAAVTGAPIVDDPGLESWNRGELEGQSVRDVTAAMQHYVENPDVPVPGGESRNSFLDKFRNSCKTILSLAEESGEDGALVAVTHLSDLLCIPAVVTGDDDLLPFPSDKIRTAEMIVLKKRGKDWTWKKYVHLADAEIPPINLRRIREELTRATVALSPRFHSSILARTSLQAAEVGSSGLISDTPQPGVISGLTAVYESGRASVFSEYVKATGNAVSLDTLASATVNRASDPAAIARGAEFNLGNWILSRQMAGVETEATDDPPDFDASAEHFYEVLNTNTQGGRAAAIIAGDAAKLAMCEGRMSAIKALKDEVSTVRIVAGLPVAEWRETL